MGAPPLKKKKIQGNMEDPQQTWGPVGAVGEGRGRDLSFSLGINPAKS